MFQQPRIINKQVRFKTRAEAKAFADKLACAQQVKNRARVKLRGTVGDVVLAIGRAHQMGGSLI